MVVSQKIIVKMMAIFFLFLRKNADTICPNIAPTNDITIIIIELFGVLWKRSTPISSIFCQMAVDIARNAPMGKSSRIYFFIIIPMLGSECLSVCISGFFSK